MIIYASQFLLLLCLFSLLNSLEFAQFEQTEKIEYTRLNKLKQDLSRKCSAWKDFRL